MAGIFAQPAPPQTAVMPSTAQDVFLVLMSVFPYEPLGDALVETPALVAH